MRRWSACCTRRAPGCTWPTSTRTPAGRWQRSSATAPTSSRSTSPTRRRGPWPWTACVGSGPLTTLVNSAGAALRRPLLDTSPDDFRRIVDLNLTGTFLGLSLAGRELARGGAIVNISSLNGVLPTAGLGAYVASKAGVSALTRVAALELAARGIRVNAVCPGSIDTAITDAPGFSDVDWDAYVRTIPLGRRGTPHEVARAVLYLASDESAYVTGTNLVIDGGIAAGRPAT